MKNTNKQLVFLDGLRGIAAIIVVLFHYAEIIQPDFSKNIIAHGFLAVDFFFCLSGFIIAYAYDHKMATITRKKFILQRLIRLHPLVIVGSIIGLLTFLLDPYNWGLQSTSFANGAIIFLTSILLIPFPVMEARYLNNFGLNAPSWSLFWEYIANILYCTLLVKLSNKLLLLLSCIAAISLILLSVYYKNLLGGWDGSTFWHGGVRMIASFSIGLLVYRKKWIISNHCSFITIAILFSCIFIIPYNEISNCLIEPLIVITLFPLIIALAAGSNKSLTPNKFISLLGQLSYPLYITHYAVMWIFGSLYATIIGDTLLVTLAIITFLTLQIIMAYLVYYWIDKPIRTMLNQKIKKS